MRRGRFFEKKSSGTHITSRVDSHNTAILSKFDCRRHMHIFFDQLQQQQPVSKKTHVTTEEHFFSVYRMDKRANGYFPPYVFFDGSSYKGDLVF